MDGIELANNIRAERNRVKKSMIDVSKELGVSYNTYQNYEKDATNVSALQIIQLAKSFNCKLEDFFVQSKSTK